MSKKRPLTSRVVIFVLMPLVVAVVFGQLYLKSSLPPSQGAFEVAALHNNVKIHRDNFGVVYLQGTNDQDVFFATGVVHAQDRLWQLELQKRIVQGRLSEVLGRDALNSDIWIRSLGIYNSAQQAWDHLSVPARQSVTSYVAGINYWITQQRVHPAEFALLGIEPQQWTELDTIAWVKMFALNLAGNMDDEITNYVAAQSLPKDKLTQLFGEKAQKFDVADPASTNTKQAAMVLDHVWAWNQQVTQQLNVGGKYVGSNAWVVSGKHTKDNKPILAIDPHLNLQIPSFWYAISQQGEQLFSKGMGLTGTPLVIFGQNREISWGGTNMMADVQDLYFETLNINRKGEYRDEGQWLNLIERVETIHVRADIPEFLNKKIKPVEIKVRSTQRGPLISDVVHTIANPVSLRWTGLDSDDTSYEAFYRLNYAQDWQNFQNALGYLVAPALNVLYADIRGNIGYVSAGRIPNRASGDGLIPLAAGAQNVNWRGYIPYQQMPKIFNPENGMIVSANDGRLFESYPNFISHAFAQDYRSVRIQNLLLDIKEPMTAQDMMVIQSDTLDLEIQQFLPWLEKIVPNSVKERQVFALLKDWSGEMTADSIAASVFVMWQREIRKLLLKDELIGYWNQGQQRETLQDISSSIPLNVVAKLLQQPTWCSNYSIEVDNKDCSWLVRKAFQQALKILDNQLGSDPKDWQWSKLQHTEYAHTPFSNIKVLDSIFERTIPTGGSLNSINVASAHYEKSKGFVQNFGAGMRQIIVLGDPNQHFYMNSTGQSGNPISPNYDDMVTKFNQVKFELFNPEPAKLNYVELVAP